MQLGSLCWRYYGDPIVLHFEAANPRTLNLAICTSGVNFDHPSRQLLPFSESFPFSFRNEYFPKSFDRPGNFRILLTFNFQSIFHNLVLHLLPHRSNNIPETNPKIIPPPRKFVRKGNILPLYPPSSQNIFQIPIIPSKGNKAEDTGNCAQVDEIHSGYRTDLPLPSLPPSPPRRLHRFY